MRKPSTMEPATILVVDDKPNNIDLLIQMLEPEGYNLAVATSGEELLTLLPVVRPDLILLDVILSGMSGFETCQKVKKIVEYADVPIIFASGKTEIKDLHQGFSVGAVDYIRKPIQQEELVARVKTHIQLRTEIRNRFRAEQAMGLALDSAEEANLDLEEMNHTLRRTIQQLGEAQAHMVQTEKMASLGNLVAGVAHEINTPLGIALTAASYSLDKAKEISDHWRKGQLSRKELQSYLDIELESCDLVQSNLKRAAQLVDNFKQVAVDQHTEERRHLALGDYIEKVVQILDAQIRDAGHHIEMTCPENIEVDSYPGSLVEIVTQLVQNSLVHAFDAGQKGRLHLNISQHEDGILFDYRDDGKGISAQFHSKIFEPFVTTRRGRGSIGLGLHIIYNLITQKLGGTIVCPVDTKEQGARFKINLPISAPQ